MLSKKKFNKIRRNFDYEISLTGKTEREKVDYEGALQEYIDDWIENEK